MGTGEVGVGIKRDNANSNRDVLRKDLFKARNVRKLSAQTSKVGR